MLPMLEAWAPLVLAGVTLVTRPACGISVSDGGHLSRTELRIAQLEADALNQKSGISFSPWWRAVVRAALDTATESNEEKVSEVQVDTAEVDEGPPAVVARRPVIILKMARTGSTWLGNALRDVAGLCDFHNEVTNIPVVFRNLSVANKSSCRQLSSYVRKQLQCKRRGVFGGITLNPFKFDVHNPLEPGSCWPQLHDTLAALNPQVVVLHRENVVAQAASDLKSVEIKALGLCDKPEDSWHLDRCSKEARTHQISPDPRKFLAVVRIKNATEQKVLAVGRTLNTAGSAGPLVLTMEDMLREGDSGLELPPKVLKFIGAARARSKRLGIASLGREGLSKLRATGARVSKFWRQQVSPQERPALKQVLENYDSVYEYFVENAPELLPLLTRA